MSESEPMTAADLLALGYEDDSFQFEDPSLCVVCTWTSQPTYQE
ncbi:hypothetical protein [Actinokineospora bangkokensis]|nr:hypothetical protein [Actinokineospora bangkokensis]